jgi:hypothetical protein
MTDTPAWIAFFLGLYALAAGVGEFRVPGGWQAMLGEVERSQALRTMIGVVCVAVGAAIYLACPWVVGDWLAIAINITGGLAVAEGLLILAAGDRFLALGRRLLVDRSGLWAGASTVFGIAAVAVALTRLPAT